MQEKIQKELEELAQGGRETLSGRRFADNGQLSPMNSAQVNGAQIEYAKFKTRALNLIGKSFGVGDDHYRELQRLGEKGEPEFINFPVCLGIVEAAQHAFESGLLFNMKSIIGAELLEDFIDQAEMLLNAGYYIPAASLAGAILEDTLSKLWTKRGLVLPTKTSINLLNIELAKAGEYTLLTQKAITTHADVRNNADHGNYTQFQPSDVEDMIKWVRRFAEEHLK
ncbi:MAG: hypothetical protein IH870_03300 [Chloroflexi bacterium]|nr:hypothetical protein [Chloroflexota bacterium]